MNRQYPLAIQDMQEVVKEDPNFRTAHYKLWYAYSVTGDQAQAWREFQTIVQTVAPAENAKRIVAAYQRGGYAASLKSFAGSHFGIDYPGSLVDGARCMIFAGNRAGAMDFLERAYRAKEGWMIFVPTDPAFDSLRSDPRFARLVHQVLSVSGRSS